VRPILVILLACLGQLGQKEEAQAILPDIESPDGSDVHRYIRAAFPYANPAHRAQLYEGLRMAGLADGL